MSSRIAIFSDIHANLEALQAVMVDMQVLRVDGLVCLGDIVGYAADSEACVNLVRQSVDLAVKGNHEEYVIAGCPEGEVVDAAERGAAQARRTLSEVSRAFLSRLPLVAHAYGCTFIHASLAQPSNWKYLNNHADLRAHFSLQDNGVCFCGHTHRPVVWHQSADGEISQIKGSGSMALQKTGKTLVNVGSVGQPRDLSNKACYAIFDSGEHTVDYRRVPYDFKLALTKINFAGLPKYSGQRLKLGR